MADVWVLLLILAFFALCVALVRGCDQIIGSDDASELGEPGPSDIDASEHEPVGVAR